MPARDEFGTDATSVHSGRIVLLNGTTCSGKSTTADALHRSVEEPWFLIDIDSFLAGRPVWNDRWHSEPVQRRLYRGFHRAVAAFAEAGNDIILVTIVPWHDPGFMAEFVSVLEPFEVLFVGVRCPFDVVEERARLRPDCPIEKALAQFDHVHRYGPYDVEVDTSRLSPHECAAVIRERLASAPVHALAHLRGRLGAVDRPGP